MVLCPKFRNFLKKSAKNFTDGKVLIYIVHLTVKRTNNDKKYPPVGSS